MKTPDMDYNVWLKGQSYATVGTAVLVETAITYATNPECRGVDTETDGACVYIDSTGTKRCALGRHLRDLDADEAGDLLSSMGASDVIEKYGLKHPRLELLDIPFWERLQAFHDQRANFDYINKTLTPRGWAALSLFLASLNGEDEGIYVHVRDVERHIQKAKAKEKAKEKSPGEAIPYGSSECHALAKQIKQAPKLDEDLAGELRSSIGAVRKIMNSDRAMKDAELTKLRHQAEVDRMEHRSSIGKLERRVQELEATVGAIKNAFG